MKTLITLISAITFMSTVHANRYDDNYTYAQVVDVQEIFQTYDVPENRRVCRDEYRKSSRNNAGKAVLGGIIGGLIGNRFGKGRGRDAATAAGILTGAAIGSNANRHRNNRGHTVKRCWTETEYHQEQRVSGYDVSYDYDGRIYQTRMQNHPGERIRVRVNVEVAEY